MISVRVQTPMLEVSVSSDSDSDSLSDVVRAAIEVGQSSPVQNSLQVPIIVKALPGDLKEQAIFQRQLPLVSAQDGEGSNNNKKMENPHQSTGNEQSVYQKRLAKGKGERTIAYNKTQELISKGYFSDGGKCLGDIQRAISGIGYTISDGKLADSLLRLVREGHLARKGERGNYVYETSEATTE
jgi:hypothetical protein